MNKGVIFDFDGVIIDSFRVQEKALLDSYRIIVGEGEPSVTEFLSYSGDSLENIFCHMNLPLTMVEPYKRISRENIDCIVVFDGIVEILNRLKEQGYKTGLCTGKNRERTIEILNYFNLSMYFDVVICSDDVGRAKPAPDSLALAIQLLSLDKKNAVMIGDAPNDIKCAKNIAMKSIAVTWGKIDRQLLEKEQPDCIVNDICEFEKVLKQTLQETEEKSIC